jgi:hypothetical protein
MKARKPIIVVTGSNRGICFKFCCQLAGKSFGQTGGSRRLSEFNATSFLDPLMRYFYPLSMPHTQITTSTLTGVP